MPADLFAPLVFPLDPARVDSLLEDWTCGLSATNEFRSLFDLDSLWHAWPRVCRPEISHVEVRVAISVFPFDPERKLACTALLRFTSADGRFPGYSFASVRGLTFGSGEDAHVQDVKHALGMGPHDDARVVRQPISPSLCAYLLAAKEAAGQEAAGREAAGL
jgi:hypothetical protein